MNQDQLIQLRWTDITRCVAAEARRWRVPEEDHEDILQSTLLSLTKNPVRLEKAWDEQALFMGSVVIHLKHALWAYRGFRGNGKRVGRAKLDEETIRVGSFQSLDEGGNDVLDERMLPLMPSAEDEYFHSTRYDGIRRAVEALPERQARAVAYRYFEGFSVAEVASALEITEDQANRAVSEGLRKLRKRLNPGQTSYPRAKLNENRKVPLNA